MIESLDPVDVEFPDSMRILKKITDSKIGFDGEKNQNVRWSKGQVEGPCSSR